MFKLKLKSFTINLFGETLSQKIFNLYNHIIFRSNRYRYRWAPFKLLISLFYQINLIIISIYKKQAIPKLKTYDIANLDLSDEFLEKVNSDIKKKEYFFLKKKFNNKYLMWKFPYSYLDEVEYSWGFDRKYYINFLNENLGDKIRKFFGGANYRVELVELFRTPKNSKNVNSSFHTDCDMPGSLKVMIYLTDVNGENGPLIIKDELNKEIEVVGKKGTAVIFRNTRVPHAGKPTINGERMAMTFMMYPTLRTKIEYEEEIKAMDTLCKLNPFSNYS